MVSRQRRRTLCATLALSALLGACAQIDQHRMPADLAQKVWRGRLALRVESNPVQSFSAGLELRGDAQAGELRLFSPLGTTQLVVSWRPGQATLRRDGQAREYDSMSSLTQAALGADLPMNALFAWLAGDNARIAGWQADLSGLGDGRLAARRSEPAPVAELRLILEP